MEEVYQCDYVFFADPYLRSTNNFPLTQSARLSLQSSELAPPAPHRQASVAHPPGSKRGGGTLAWRRGGGRSQLERMDRL
jgi:hypothetical protein